MRTSTKSIILTTALLLSSIPAAWALGGLDDLVGKMKSTTDEKVKDLKEKMKPSAKKEPAEKKSEEPKESEPEGEPDGGEEPAGEEE